MIREDDLELGQLRLIKISEYAPEVEDVAGALELEAIALIVHRGGGLRAVEHGHRVVVPGIHGQKRFECSYFEQENAYFSVFWSFLVVRTPFSTR